MLALVRTYQAFGVHGGARPDPRAYYADPANSLAAAKNAFNIVLTLISDAIIVSACADSSAPRPAFWTLPLSHAVVIRSRWYRARGPVRLRALMPASPSGISASSS